MDKSPGDLEAEARLADAGELLLRVHRRLEGKKRRQRRPGLRLVKGAKVAPSRRPVQRDGDQEP